MRLTEIIDIERHMGALTGRLAPLLEPEHREALERTLHMLAEVRHFAVCWEDASSIEIESRQIDYRKRSVDRLVQALAPD